MLKSKFIGGVDSLVNKVDLAWKISFKHSQLKCMLVIIKCIEFIVNSIECSTFCWNIRKFSFFFLRFSYFSLSFALLNIWGQIPKYSPP